MVANAQPMYCSYSFDKKGYTFRNGSAESTMKTNSASIPAFLHALVIMSPVRISLKCPMWNSPLGVIPDAMMCFPPRCDKVCAAKSAQCKITTSD